MLRKPSATATKAKKQPGASRLVPGPYELSGREAEAIASHQARRQHARPFPRQTVTVERGVSNLADNHPDPLVGASLTMEALGLTRVGELTALLQNVVELTQKDRKADEPGINQLMAQIAAVEPQDGIEAMLATQMAVVHQATLKTARALRGVETIPQQDSASNAFNKLARTFAAQVEALKRYRSKGEQKVVVEHVTVNEGGQAIVGQVGGSSPNEK
jgi:hypothetical protein